MATSKLMRMEVDYDSMKRRDKKRPPMDARRIIAKNTSANDSKCRILVDNLRYSVTGKDLESLFSKIGAVRKAAVFFREDGTSTGTGEVIFFRHTDATMAMKKFNNVALDGRQMKMKFVSDRAETITRTTVAKRQNVEGAGNTFRQPLKTRRPRVFKRQQKQKRMEAEVSKPTKDQLDMEIDEFMSETKAVELVVQN